MKSLNINFKNFKSKKKNLYIKKNLDKILKKKNYIIESLKTNFNYKFDKKTLSKYSKFKNFRIIGMGGSSLGTQAIYDFLNHKIKKKFCKFNCFEIRKHN